MMASTSQLATEVKRDGTILSHIVAYTLIKLSVYVKY